MDAKIKIKKTKPQKKESPAPPPMIETELPPTTAAAPAVNLVAPTQKQPSGRVICPRCDTLNSFRPMAGLRGASRFDREYKQCRRCGFKVRM